PHSARWRERRHSQSRRPCRHHSRLQQPPAADANHPAPSSCLWPCHSARHALPDRDAALSDHSWFFQKPGQSQYLAETSPQPRAGSVSPSTAFRWTAPPPPATNTQIPIPKSCSSSFLSYVRGTDDTGSLDPSARQAIPIQTQRCWALAPGPASYRGTGWPCGAGALARENSIDAAASVPLVRRCRCRRERPARALWEEHDFKACPERSRKVSNRLPLVIPRRLLTTAKSRWIMALTSPRLWALL